jgi:hypothetical protein
MGDPLRIERLVTLPKGLLAREAPKIDTEGLLADCGRRSWGGDSMKHSPSDIDVELDSLLLPAPKRKGGNCVCWGSAAVENAFVLAMDGRAKMAFRFLKSPC